MLDAGYWMLDDGYQIPDVEKNADLNSTCKTAHHLLHIVAMIFYILTPPFHHNSHDPI